MTSLTMSSVRPFFPCANNAAQTLVAMQVYCVRCRRPGTSALAILVVPMPLGKGMQTLVNHKGLWKRFGCNLHPPDSGLLQHADHKGALLWGKGFLLSNIPLKLLAELRKPRSKAHSLCHLHVPSPRELPGLLQG